MTYQSTLVRDRSHRQTVLQHAGKIRLRLQRNVSPSERSLFVKVYMQVQAEESLQHSFFHLCRGVSPPPLVLLTEKKK